MNELAVEPGELGLAREAPVAPPSPLKMAGQALLFNDRAYDAIATSAAPGKRGFSVLIVILAALILAQGVGLLLGVLTQPNLSSLQSFLRETITGLPWYAQQSAATPGFAAQFQQSYALSWDGLRTLLGYRTLPGAIGSVVSLVLSALIWWLLFSAIAYALAQWFGSRVRFNVVLGATAVAMSPLLLSVIQAIPGAVAPFELIALALLATHFQAIRRISGLSPGHSLAVVLGVTLILILLLFGLLLFGLALGVQRIPFLDQVLRAVPLLPR